MGDGAGRIIGLEARAKVAEEQRDLALAMLKLALERLEQRDFALAYLARGAKAFLPRDAAPKATAEKLGKAALSLPAQRHASRRHTAMALMEQAGGVKGEAGDAIIRALVLPPGSGGPAFR